jgi:hypothetical protein
VRRHNRYYKEGIKNPKKLPTSQLKSIYHESAVKPKNIKRSLPYSGLVGKKSLSSFI